MRAQDDDALIFPRGAYEVERRLGETHGLSVEVWTAPSTQRAALVLLPTTRGVSVVMAGSSSEVEVEAMARTGRLLLAALQDVTPIITGEWFRRGEGGRVQASYPGLRQ